MELRTMIQRRHFLKIILLTIFSFFTKKGRAERKHGTELKEAMFWKRLDT
jgi:hypothetical protein